MFDITLVRYELSKRSIYILCWKVPSNWQRIAEQLLHITSFLCVIYPILNASVILSRNETQLSRNEKRLERIKTRIARNETRGGNLLLSGTVHVAYNYMYQTYPYQGSCFGDMICINQLGKLNPEVKFIQIRTNISYSPIRLNSIA